MNDKQNHHFYSVNMDKFRRKLCDITNGRKYKQTCSHSKSACALVSACAALIPSRSCLRSTGQSSAPLIQNFQIVWLDANIDELNNDICRSTIAILRHIVNTVNIFVEADECMDHIRRVKEDKIFMIVSEEFGQMMMPIVSGMPQVTLVYILCENKLEHELWVHNWSKIRGVFMDDSIFYETLKQAARECDQNTISISYIQTSNGTSNKKLGKLDQSFIHTQILKEIVSTTNFKQLDIREFLTYYRKQIVGNAAELGNVDKFEREYHDHGPIWWYTYPCFLYSMLNRALRFTEESTLIKMGFFIHDLHQYITQLHHKQNIVRHDATSFVVYRGQGMSQTEFDQLKKTQNGLLSFNNFLFTSKNHNVSLDFARQTIATSDLLGIVFVMTVDPAIASTPYANIRDVSSHPTDEEILFSIQPVFRIDQVKQIDDNNRLWQIELTLIGDDDPQLHVLTERILEKTACHREGWCRLSELLIKEGQFKKAEEVCGIIMNQTSDDKEKGFLNYQLGLIKFHQGEYTEAKSFYKLSLEILPPEHIDVAACYNELSLVYEKTNEYSKALASIEKAMQIYGKTLPANDPHLTDCTNNIGRMYFHMGEYAKSLSYYEKSLEIYQNTRPPNHHNIVTSYNNIGSVYEKMGQYSQAISFLEKTLSIHKKCLLPNHSEIADLYNNIGSLYEKMCEYTIALSYYEKSLEIYEGILPPDHPDLAASHNNIGLVYFQRGDYLRALSFHEKAHEIYRKILPANHPHLAASYVCQGSVHEEMCKYTTALLYYKKAFEIYRNTQSANPLDLAAFYHAIGSVYCKMCEYSTALSCHNKALEIYEKNLPSNHPDLANSYVWHGDLYDKMGDYLKAFSSYQCALDIGQHSFPANHPCLQRWKDNLELIKKKF
jgi:tetratricopeptide (TPR) repeat protein